MKFINLSIILALFIAVPTIVSAHGGVESSTDTVVVFMKQDPLSPLVGEEVKMNFVFTNKNDASIRYKNLTVTLSLVDTYYGDESRDKEILTRTVNTDANGSMDFSYTYEKENYFDVNLTFKDPVTGEDSDVGFLVQPRKSSATATNLNPYLVS